MPVLYAKLQIFFCKPAHCCKFHSYTTDKKWVMNLPAYNKVFPFSLAGSQMIGIRILLNTLSICMQHYLQKGFSFYAMPLIFRFWGQKCWHFVWKYATTSSWIKRSGSQIISFCSQSVELLILFFIENIYGNSGGTLNFLCRRGI